MNEANIIGWNSSDQPFIFSHLESLKWSRQKYNSLINKKIWEIFMIFSAYHSNWITENKFYIFQIMLILNWSNWRSQLSEQSNFFVHFPIWVFIDYLIRITFQSLITKIFQEACQWKKFISLIYTVKCTF